jgi:hypothetical protein
VNKRADVNLDFNRAMILLKKRFHTPHDMILYWAMSGPCREPHPSIEDINEDE